MTEKQPAEADGRKNRELAGMIKRPRRPRQEHPQEVAARGEAQAEAHRQGGAKPEPRRIAACPAVAAAYQHVGRPPRKQ